MRSRQLNNNTTTQQGDHDEVINQAVKLTNFPSETWAMLSSELKKWFIQLKKTVAAGGGPILGSSPQV